MADCGVLPYDEASGTGELRYVQAAVVGSSPTLAPVSSAAQAGPGLHGSSSDGSGSASSGSRRASSSAAGCSVQLTLVWNASSAGAAEGTPGGARLEALAARLWQLVQQQAEAVRQRAGSQQHRHGPAQGAPGLLHSLWANFQPARSNAILGPEWRLLRGEEEAWARLGGTDICFGPGSFMQVTGQRVGSAVLCRQAGAVQCRAGRPGQCSVPPSSGACHVPPSSLSLQSSSCQQPGAAWPLPPPLCAGQPRGHEQRAGSHAEACPSRLHHR